MEGIDGQKGIHIQDLGSLIKSSKTLSNGDLARELVLYLLDAGVQDFCLCPGARNAPFIFLFEQMSLHFSKAQMRFHTFFDERAAGFFAYGKSIQTSRPVAIFTTSGTAAAELLPVAVESYYTEVPLLFVTSDRPKRYRGSGAPQTIEQVGIFGQYSYPTIDLDFQNANLPPQLPRKYSSHINVCFEEPLTDHLWAITLLKENESLFLKSWENGNHKTLPIPILHKELPSSSFSSNQKKYSPWCIQNPILVIGSLRNNEFDLVLNFIEQNPHVPFFAESLSGLREFQSLLPQRILCEKTLHQLCSFSLPHTDGFSSLGILRLGGIPTARFWRDLEDRYSHIPVWSISSTSFRGLARPSRHEDWGQLDHIQFEGLRYQTQNQISEGKLLNRKIEWTSESDKRDLDSENVRKLNSLLDQYPRSEPSLIRRISHQIPFKDSVYLGNSMSIRNWEIAYFGSETKLHRSNSDPLFNFEMEPPKRKWLGNKGANGIDGQISTFLGWCSEYTPIEPSSNWAFLGDLTALYDLNALAIEASNPQIQYRIFIMNNMGGKIFQPMFNSLWFQNTHTYNFEGIAKSFGWKHYFWDGSDSPIFLDIAPMRKVIIESFPDSEQTENFWKDYRKL